MVLSGLPQVVEPGFICRWFYDVHTKKLYKLDEALSEDSEIDEHSRSKLQLMLQRTKDRMVESQLQDDAARAQQQPGGSQGGQEDGAEGPGRAGDPDAEDGEDGEDSQGDQPGPSSRQQRASRAERRAAAAGDHADDPAHAAQRRKKVVLPVSDDEDE